MNDNAYAPYPGDPLRTDCECDEKTAFGRMQAWLKLQTEDVREHVKIQSPTDLNQSFFLRIDKNPPPKFFPNMPKTAMKGENATMPRVTVAPTLLGCLIGYFRAEYDVVYSGGKNTDGEVSKGGYVISAFDLDNAKDVFLRPDDTLVPQEVERSDEHWLVAFDEEHVEYPARPVGKCFLSEVAYVNQGGTKRPQIKLRMWVETTLEAFPLAPATNLQAGYYCVDIRWESLMTRDVREHDKELIKIQSVTKEQYLTQKHISADLLSFQEPAKKPAFMAW